MWFELVVTRRGGVLFKPTIDLGWFPHQEELPLWLVGGVGCAYFLRCPCGYCEGRGECGDKMPA